MSKIPPTGSSGIRFEAMIQHMDGLNYWQRRVFLWHRVAPHLARFLYKFRPLVPDNKTSVDHMRDILVRSRLWLSSPVSFNDPFDMAIRFIAEGTVTERKERFEALLKRQGVKWGERSRRLPGLVAKGVDELAALTQGAHEKNVRVTGVCSFGGDPHSIQMWSHYASNHEGFCLQLEVAKDVGVFVLALPVEYSNEYPVVNWIRGFRDGLKATMLRKHTGWRYEREQRIVLPEAAEQYLGFRAESLKGIIIGCRVKPATLERLHELLAERSSAGFLRPTLYRAFRHESKYRLVIKKEA